MIRPTIVISLIEANQNSDSPKKGTAMMLRRRIVTRMMVIQTAGLMSSFCLYRRWKLMVCSCQRDI